MTPLSQHPSPSSSLIDLTPIHTSIYVFICSPTHPLIHLSIYPSIHLSNNAFIHTSTLPFLANFLPSSLTFLSIFLFLLVFNPVRWIVLDCERTSVRYDVRIHLHMCQFSVNKIEKTGVCVSCVRHLCCFISMEGFDFNFNLT